MMETDHDTVLGTIPNGGQVIAASGARGVELLTTVDDFVRHQSRFDRHARLNLPFGVANVTPEMYLAYVASQVMAWSPAEIHQLEQIVGDIASVLARFDFDLPAPIYLVKTTGQEEAHAAYTRNRNTIVLPANMVGSLWVPSDFGDPLHGGASRAYLQGVLLHECFHLFSKNNVARRRSLYEAVGYRLLDEQVELPDVPWPEADSTSSMTELKITNPDTPRIDVLFELQMPGSAESAKEGFARPVVPVLMASGPYEGGSFFGQLRWYFMEVEERDEVWRAQLVDGRPVMHLVEPGGELYRLYERTVGCNFSDELFHPDEVLAQNWTLVASEPSLGLLVKMTELLTR